jgi:hypothetical protein
VEIASAYAGTPLDPHAVERDAAPGGQHDPIGLAMELVRTACVGASVSAMVAKGTCDRCGDRVVRRTLRRIAVDETRHAALGWAYLKWALSPNGVLAAGSALLVEAVSAALDEERTSCTIPSPPRHSAREHWLAEQGRLSAAGRAGVVLETLRDVVVPCARATMAVLTDGVEADVA